MIKINVANIDIDIDIDIAKGLKTKILATSGKISKNVVRMKNNVVRMKISKNIANSDFEDNITNIAILSRC